jgi:hypothetical protein
MGFEPTTSRTTTELAQHQRPNRRVFVLVTVPREVRFASSGPAGRNLPAVRRSHFAPATTAGPRGSCMTRNERGEAPRHTAPETVGRRVIVPGLTYENAPADGVAGASLSQVSRDRRSVANQLLQRPACSP